MTSAFDWSPGGCCCGPEDGRFDFYCSFAVSPPNPPLGMLRGISLAAQPVGGGPSPHPQWHSGMASINPSPWSIPIDADGLAPILSAWRIDISLVGGFAEDEEYVWTLESQIGPRGRVAGWDAVAQVNDVSVEINLTTFAVPLLTQPSIYAGGIVFFNATASTTFPPTLVVETYRAGTMAANNDVLYVAGYLVTKHTGAVTEYKGNSSYTHFTTHDVTAAVIKAPRNWPNGAGTRTTPIAAGNPNLITRFFTGDFSRFTPPGTPPPGTPLPIAQVVSIIEDDQDIFFTTNNGAGGWHSFDSTPSGWIGVIYWNEGTSRNAALYIDGERVIHFSHSSANPSHTAKLLAEACFPNIHAARTEGVYTATVVQFTTPPSTATPFGIVADSTKPYALIVFNKGAGAASEVLKAPGFAYCYVTQSSARWLFAECYPSTPMPRAAYELLTPGGAGFMIHAIRPDGAVTSPLGTLNKSTNKINPSPLSSPLHPARGGFVFEGSNQYGAISLSCVRNPDLIPGCLPADPADFASVL